MPLSAPYIPRNLVKPLPSAAQFEQVSAALAAGGTIEVAFDVALAITDRNQLGVLAAPAPTPRVAIGPFLDVVAFSAQNGTILVSYAVAGGSYRELGTTAVPATILTNISGLRVTARFVRVRYTNTSAVAALVEFGVYVRST